MGDFEPTIIAFVCNWCTYTAADLAGTARLGYPANVRLIRVMCTGMVDPKYVIKALLEGADAVLVSGVIPETAIISMEILRQRGGSSFSKRSFPNSGLEMSGLG